MAGTAPSGWQTPKTNWQPADVVQASDLNRIEGNINAIEQGARTLDQAQAPSGNEGSLRQILSWLANRIRAITGMANWYDAPPTTLGVVQAELDAHVSDDVSNGVHGMGSIAGQDYEEGTWTPRITGNNAYSVQTGSYIRLGNIIQIEGRIVLSSLDDSISSADLSIEGLPFVGKNGFGGVSVGYTFNTNIPTDRIGIRGFVTGNAIPLYAPTINSPRRLLGEHLTNISEIRFTATYQI